MRKISRANSIGAIPEAVITPSSVTAGDVAVEAASAVPARSEIFAAVAGVVEIVEHSGPGQCQRGAADGRDGNSLDEECAREFDGLCVAVVIPS